MKSASLVVRVTINGKRKNLSPEQAKAMGVSGTFYMRTWEGGKEKWKAIGTDPSLAKTAVIRKASSTATARRRVQRHCVKRLTSSLQSAAFSKT